MKSAILFVDLQRDFLSNPEARMPISAQSTTTLLGIANAILEGRQLPGVLPIMVVNEFSPRARLMNALRRHAAIAGTPGAQLDPRLADSSHAARIAKAHPSAFTNPELERILRRAGIEHLYVMGVMAEACVRATVRDALKRGYRVSVIEDGIASTSQWKLRWGLGSMKRAGAQGVHLSPKDAAASRARQDHPGTPAARVRQPG